MRSKIFIPILFALLIAPGIAPAASAATGTAQTVSVPESIIARNVPQIPQEGTEELLPYENLRTANFVDWHPTERRMLIRTRFAESPQIHEVAMPMGARTQLTYYKDQVMGALYRPGRPGQYIYTLNEGGAENFQFFIVDPATGKARRFTDGKSRHVSPVWSNDGKLLAYASNARNGRDFDLYVADPSTPGSERRVAELKGSWNPLDWSPDNRRILLSEDISANEGYLHWVDVATGEIHTLTPRRPAGSETVAYQGGLWSKDGRSVYAANDLDSEFLRIVRIDVDAAGKPGKPTVVSGDIPWDVEDFDLSEDGSLLAFMSNEDGFSQLHVIDLRTGKEAPKPELPEGVAGGLQFRPGSHEIAFSISWARAPSDVYCYDVDSKRLERWTASETGGLNTAGFAVPELVHYPSFDGRKIPAYVYRPPADRFPGPRPVYINIHGGPEGQSRPNFLGSNNYFINELGVVNIVPNVRGSSGYGKSFLKMDNGDRREDSVKDIGALLDWIATQPDLDSKRVMVSGGSYGGYMVLAALVHYSDRLCCAFESVGISNFITFLQNTSGYRQDLRRVEYGDERDPQMREYLEKIAPIKHVQRMTKPLLVAQGANDPRVPLSESDQIVAALESRGVPVWYLVGKDEGHGFSKKTNTDYQRAVLVRFMREFLLGEGKTATTGSR
jgi:dipeptidyl aminopeptidase/acylaminoacyl peptidase